MLWPPVSQTTALCSSKSFRIILQITLIHFYRHEIAFVFGQLLSPDSVPSLISVLQNSTESDMVRHEAAEALGGIATPECLPHLKEWMIRDDSPQVVKESCQIAVDMWEYENSGEFQYANGVVGVEV
jgi:deoxyhypusine monooxygenase